MPDIVCKHCGCSEIDEDATRGDKVCTNCGSVLEEQLIVSEIQFQENAAGGASVMGQFVSMEGNKSYTCGGTFTRGIGRDSRMVTLQNAKQKIQQVGGQLHLNTHNIEEAYNFFKLALSKNLTRGRKTLHVVAACLYIVCRRNSTSHMLLDLSDVLQVNVYTLGKTFLHITKELCLCIPVVDPCLYIDRFAGRLQFGDKGREVISTALRLVQRMKRDWIHTGRRPAGLCGAALLVSARMHDFNRTVKQVIKVVKVCESTVRKRLSEFEDTPSSQLTLEEFHNIDLEEDQDPPCFTEGKKRYKLNQLEEQDPQQLNNRLAEIESLQKEIEKSLVAKKPSGIWAHYAKMADEDCSSSTKDVEAATNFIEEETMRDVLTGNNKEPAKVANSGGKVSADCSADRVTGDEVRQDQADHDSKLIPTSASLGMQDVVEDCITATVGQEVDEANGELDLEGIDDGELDMLLLTEDEVKVKTEFWMKENADYLQAQQEKEEKRLREEQEHGPKPEKKKKRYKKREKYQTEAASAAEAVARVIQEKKLSNKINYKVLDDLKALQKPAFMRGKAEDDGSTASALTTSRSILKTEPQLNRFKRPSLLDPEEVTPAKKKMVQIQEPVTRTVEEEPTTPAVLVETGPVQYDEPEPEPELDDYEEEEEEEAHVSVHQIFGTNVTADDDDAYYDLL